MLDSIKKFALENLLVSSELVKISFVLGTKNFTGENNELYEILEIENGVKNIATSNLDITNTKMALERIYSSGLAIDTDCPFFVRLKITDVEHKRGSNFQSLLYEYILSHYDNIPNPVKEYIHQKRCGIGFSNGCWEFKCFGNVSSSTMALDCIYLAIQAMQGAYKIKFGGFPELPQNDDSDNGFSDND